MTTKARTVGAARRGRKRGPGPRYPGGQKRHAPADNAALPVLERRCRDMGWPVTPENVKRAKSHRLGTAWGRLAERGVLTVAETAAQRQLDCDRYHEALEQFARLRCLSRALWGLPPDRPKIARLDDVRYGSDAEPDEDKVLAARRAFADAERALSEAGDMARMWVYQLVAHDREDVLMREVVRGAEALARHFEIKEG